MLRLPEPSFRGRHFQITQAWNEPRSLRNDPIPLGVWIDRTLPSLQLESTIDSTARFAEFGVIDAVVRSPPDELVESFRAAARRGGRLPGVVGLLARLQIREPGFDDLENNIRQILAIGFDGVIIDWQIDVNDCESPADVVRRTRVMIDQWIETTPNSGAVLR
jgi:hypothetical protein